MSSTSQLRQQARNVQAATSETNLRRQTISTTNKPPQLTQEQYEAQQVAGIIQENVSKLESEKVKAEQQLTSLKESFDKQIEDLNKQGKLDSGVYRGLTQDFLNKRKYIVGDIQGYEKAISEAKTGAYTLESLKQYKGNIASAVEQEMNVQARVQEERAKPKQEIIVQPQIISTRQSTSPTTTAYRNIITKQIVSATSRPSAAYEKVIVDSSGKVVGKDIGTGTTPFIIKDIRKEQSISPITNVKTPSKAGLFINALLPVSSTESVKRLGTVGGIVVDGIKTIGGAPTNLMTGKSISPNKLNINIPSNPITEKINRRINEINRETKVYENQGYSRTEARKLATEGVNRQISISEEGASNILKEAETKVIGKGLYFNTGTDLDRINQFNPSFQKTKTFNQNNLFTADIDKLQRQYRQAKVTEKSIEKLSKEIETLSKNNIDKNNNWIGSAEDYEKYSKKYEELQNAITKSESQTINVGMGTAVEKVPITSFGWLGSENKLFRDIQAAPSIISSTISTGVKEGYKSLQGLFNVLGTGGNKVLTSENTIITPEIIRTTYQPSGTIMNFGQPNQQYVLESQYVQPENKVLRKNVFDVLATTTKVAGKIGEFGGTALPYLNPVGDIIYMAEQGGRLGQNIQTTRGVTTGIKSWYGEAPLLSTITLSIPLLKGTKFITKNLRLTKESKYLSQPEAKYIELSSNKPSVNKYIEEVKGARVNILDKEGNLIGNIAEKIKGKLKVAEYYPSVEVSGRVVEVRKMPSVISFLKGKGFFQLKKFVGRAVVTSEGVYKEGIRYSKNIRKVTNVDKRGKGLTQLFKNEKLIKQLKNIPSEASKFTQSKPTRENIKIDEQIGNKGVIVEERIIKGISPIGKRVRVIASKETLSGDIIVSDLGTPTNLEATKVYGEFERVKRVGKNIKEGEFTMQEDIYGFTDITKSGERKGMVGIKKGDNVDILKKRVGQEIVYGQPKNIDIAVKQTYGDTSNVVRAISPSTSRQIVEGGDTIFTQLYVNPKNKAVRNLIKEETSKNKVWSNLVSITEKDKAVIKPKVDVVKSSKDIIVKEEMGVPSYIDMGSQRQVLQSNQLMPSLSEQVIIEHPSTYLKGRILSKQINIPNIYYFESTKNLNLPRSNLKDSSIQFNVLPTKVQEGIKESSLTIPKSETITKQNNDTIYKTNVREIQKPQEVFSNLEVQELAQEQYQQMQSKQLTKTRLEQLFKQTNQQRQRQEQQQKVKPNIKFSFGNALKKVKQMAQEEGGLFSIFVTKGGKNIEIGKRKTKEEAERLLGKELFNTLRAGGGIEREGIKLKASEINLGFGYKPSKINPFKIIEMKERRLKKGTQEIPEIMSFKKGKKEIKRKNLFSI